MSMIRICDKCGKRIDTNAPIGEQSWVQAAVALDETVREGGYPKDYHRACARDIMLAEVWKRPALVDL